MQPDLLQRIAAPLREALERRLTLIVPAGGVDALGSLIDLGGLAVLGIVVGVVAAVVVVWWVLRPFVRWWTTTYTFTDRRFIERSGFIAKEGRTIPLNRISGVDFEIGVAEVAPGENPARTLERAANGVRRRAAG